MVWYGAMCSDGIHELFILESTKDWFLEHVTMTTSQNTELIWVNLVE
jgi:hypothetical protein